MPLPDKHLLFISNKLGVPLAASSFAKASVFSAFKRMLAGYATSTAENYAWRLHRYLASDPSFSPLFLKGYSSLVVLYKGKYGHR